MSQDPNAPQPTPPPQPVPPLPPLPPTSTAGSMQPVMDYATKGGAMYSGPVADANARQWGMIAHLAGFVGFFVAVAAVGPLVVWLLKKQEHPFIDDQGKEALNFQITAMLVFIVLAPTFCIGIGFILYPIVVVGFVILMIIAAMEANKGVAYRYPWTLRLVK